jgi:hypothetical protein
LRGYTVPGEAMDDSPEFDLSALDHMPSSAGVYDYALGGTTNTAADRQMAEEVQRLVPDTFLAAWANRGFLQRAVRFLAAEAGVRQFIDLGAGFPTQGNTHEVVAGVRPDGHVVYVDRDPRVVWRSKEITSDSPGTTAILADIRDTAAVLGHPDTLRLIDFSEPVAVLAVAVTHFISNEDDPWGMISAYVDALCPGSYLAICAASNDHLEERWEEVRKAETSGYNAFPRTKAEVRRYFAGLQIVPPYPGALEDICYIGLWGAEDPDLADDEGSRLGYAAVARKP